MYSKAPIHKQFVDGNAYITVGDPYKVQNGNPFRAPVKGEKLKPMECPVKLRTSHVPHTLLNGYNFCLFLMTNSLSANDDLKRSVSRIMLRMDIFQK